MSKYILAVSASLILVTAASADEIFTENGSRLTGTLVSASDNEVVFETPFAGEITLKQANIKKIITQSPVTLLMEDGSVYRDKDIIADEESIFVLKDNQQHAIFDVADIQLVNPEPWLLGEGYKWFGIFETTIESNRGNTDSDKVDVELESIWRSLVDRYTIRAGWEIDEADGDQIKSNWRLRNKYDRFVRNNTDNYYGIQLFFEHNKFADLDLRSTLGPYFGRQFFETEYLNLHGELGVVYVDEQFDEAEDDGHMGGTWEIRIVSGIIPNAELYFDHAGILNVEDISDVITKTRIGLRYPLFYGFTAAADVSHEYDGGAVEGVQDTDESYNIRMGYRW